MFQIYLYILYAVCVCVLCWYRWSRGDSESPPLHSKCLPILGHTLLLNSINNTEDLYKSLYNTSMECVNAGGVLRMIIGNDVYYILTDPEACLTVSNEAMNKHYAYGFAKDWLANGLITSSGSTWKVHRKLLSPSFTLQVLLGFITSINALTNNFIDDIQTHENGGYFDVSIYIRKLVLKNILKSLLGLKADQDELLKTYPELIDSLLNISASRFHNIMYHSDFIYNLSAMKREETRAVKIVNNFADEIIRKKRQDINNNRDLNKDCCSEIKQKPFLELLLQLSEEGKLTDKEIREEVETIMVAALDTTTWVLTIILVLLGSHKEVQDKAFNEIQEVLGDSERDIDKHDLPKLVYLEAVIKEALRLYPVGAISIRTLDKDVKLKKYTLRAGHHCLISMLGLHRSGWWGEDAGHFTPERWVGPSVPHHAFAGFSLGRRNCIGRTYAMISLKTILCHTLRRYKITADYTQLQLKLDFVLKPVAGHYIQIERR